MSPLRRIFFCSSSILVCLAAGSPSALAGEPAPAAAYWVSPAGNDAWPGSREEPFLTLERARDAVRLLDKSHLGEGDAKDVVVFLRGGDHRRERKLALDGRDSGSDQHDVVYRAEPGELPVIRGSLRVQGWQPHDPARAIYRAQLPPAPPGHFRSRQLYVNGKRAVRARTEPLGSAGNPAYPVGFRAAFPCGIEFLLSEQNPAEWRDPAGWTNPQQVEAVLYTQWKMLSVPLYAISPQRGKPNLLDPQPSYGLLRLREPGWTNANQFVGSDGRPGIWSFWRVGRFENAYEFLNEPGEWYLDEARNLLFYIPREGEDLKTADVELPLLEVLVEAFGQPGQPVAHLRFEGLTFSGATWLAPSGDDGYVADQSGFHLTGKNPPTTNGHYADPARTPGNLRFRHAKNIELRGNIFEHLGAVGVDFDTGSQGNLIAENLFEDISSAAIQLGGISRRDHHPENPQDLTRDNKIEGNLIRQAAREFIDAAGIMIGFTENSRIASNTIVDVPWSGIAMGWGWGLLDPGSFLGLPGAEKYQWGKFDTPTASNRNRIVANWIEGFVATAWDGGAIYTTGQQAHSMDTGEALLIAGNVATGKRPQGGSNVLYTDGGSRYIHLEGNLAFGNPVGVLDFGPAPLAADKLPPLPPFPWAFPWWILNGIPYGADRGGCRTYGHLRYVGNYWEHEKFFDICPYTDSEGVKYPVDLEAVDNHVLGSGAELPQQILAAAGAPKQPPGTIPAGRWVLPPIPTQGPPAAATPAAGGPGKLLRDLKIRLRQQRLGDTRLGFLAEEGKKGKERP